MLIKSSILKYEDAVSIYDSFHNKLKINTLSPIYANVDSFRDPNIKTIYWYANSNEEKFLHSFHMTLSLLMDMVGQFVIQKTLNF